MQITRTSQLSGVTRTMDMPISVAQWSRYMQGMHIQNAFPFLTAGQREFIMTGITDEEWQKAFPKEEEEDGD